MPATDIQAKVRAAALAAIEKQCFGEDFGFDCSLVIAPGPAGKPVVFYQLVTTKKSPLLGQPPLMNISQIMHADPEPEAVEKVITGALQGLRELAAKILAGQN